MKSLVLANPWTGGGGREFLRCFLYSSVTKNMIDFPTTIILQVTAPFKNYQLI